MNKETKLPPDRSKLSRPFVLVCILLVLIVIPLATGGIYHSILRKVSPSVIVRDNSVSLEESAQQEIPVENVNNDPNAGVTYLTADSFTEYELTASDMYNGDLVLVDEEHPYIGDKSDFTDYNQEEVNGYWISDYDLSFQRKMVTAINEMAAAYNAAFDNDKRFFIYNTSETDTSQFPLCPEIIPERESGYSLDIVLKAESSGATELTDEVAKWLSENCANYGFIKRYTENSEMGDITYHYRFVGKANAALMTELGMGLEEYLEFLKGYNWETPYCFSSNGYNYEIFYIQSQGDITVANVPKSNDYYISGNNMDGYVEIVLVNSSNQ